MHCIRAGWLGALKRFTSCFASCFHVVSMLLTLRGIRR
ncbi:hypothetical protein CPter291_5219 [Collimonas pratensis]|uniref:Transposase n=1 Tax=Collimonas pratensis TaxID=279113 RepID=A0ABN4MHK1_9BURK|nr:hypothetical protein CPter291_5219 [Collimonas pratensis]